MRYYVVTTTKFADRCLEYRTYGATEAKWLVNINIGDIVFLSQFNYKSQQIFGPFRVIKNMFYNKSIIYPTQRYFYRIQMAAFDSVHSIEETDLYLNGLQAGAAPFYFRLIALLQQNKHMHCISLTDEEGMAIQETINNFGNLHHNHELRTLTGDIENIDCEYIWKKNKLAKKRQFTSESDLETYLILSLKNKDSLEFKIFNGIITRHSGCGLMSSKIYNQFILGNAYPADIAVLNAHSSNVFELKKSTLAGSMVPQIEKEIKKHLYFSLLSERGPLNNEVAVFNFFLVCPSGGDKRVQRSISGIYESLENKIQSPRKNNLIFLAYELNNNTILIHEM